MDSVAPLQKSRSGSEHRKRSAPPISVRVNEAERAEIAEAAARATLTVGSYVRSRLLANPTTKSRRQPSVDLAVLTRLLGQVNKVGSNLHQIARRVNFGDTPAGQEFVDALAGYKEVNAAIMEALGRVPK